MKMMKMLLGVAVLMAAPIFAAPIMSGSGVEYSDSDGYNQLSGTINYQVFDANVDAGGFDQGDGMRYIYVYQIVNNSGAPFVGVDKFSVGVKESTVYTVTQDNSVGGTEADTDLFRTFSGNNEGGSSITDAYAADFIFTNPLYGASALMIVTSDNAPIMAGINGGDGSGSGSSTGSEDLPSLGYVTISGGALGSTIVVPEPATLTLMGLAGLFLRRRK